LRREERLAVTHIRLNNGNDSLALADGGVAGEGVRVVLDGEGRRAVIGHAVSCPPLGEAHSDLLVLRQALRQVVQALRAELVLGEGNHDEPFVGLHPGQDALGQEVLREGNAVVRRLVHGLIEKDHPGDVLVQALRRKQELREREKSTKAYLNFAGMSLKALICSIIKQDERSRVLTFCLFARQRKACYSFQTLFPK